MKYGLFALLITLGLSVPASAALSGFYDASEQVQAVVGSDKVSFAMGGRPFDTLEQVRTRDNGQIEWRVQNSECYVIVTLTPVPPAGPGKTTYEVANVSACEGSDLEGAESGF
ncbi:hypothetical protein [Shinella oryzae]|uniref:hypothetical protein n=1 Tax=Shinella oryzae TaxID=2871820 RepID=UPI001FF1BCBB|nr:hypothetical protein [Shinella oryzae]UPA25949.1 hypothetical protein K6301_07150 [Shinella oryzae]